MLTVRINIHKSRILKYIKNLYPINPTVFKIKIHPGVNVGRGGDDTLFALVDGTVKFERKGKDRKQVSVYPVVSND